MIPVSFYSFAKKNNSTKRPTEAGLTFNCLVKDECGVVAPNIEIGQSEIVNPSVYNFAYIPNWHRYYYIDEWTFHNGYWSASLQCDVLATYKNEITGSTQYVERTSKDGKWNGNIIDKYYPVQAGHPFIKEEYGGKPWVDEFENGTYVLGVIGDNQGASGGAVTYVAMTQSQFGDLMQKLYDPASFDFHTLFTEPKELEQFKAQFNPMQYIVSCMWFPFPPDTSRKRNPLKLGWYDIPGTWYETNVHDFVFNTSFAIPRHPQAEGEGLYSGTVYHGENRGVYLDIAPYSEYVLDFKPYGQIQLDGTKFIGKLNLICNGKVDLITGESILTIMVNRGTEDPLYPGQAVIETRRAKVGVEMTIAQVAKDYVAQGVSFVKGVAQTVGQVKEALNPLKNLKSYKVAGWSDVVASAAGTIGDVINNQYPHADIAGNNGTSIDFDYTPRLIGTFRYITTQNVDHVGRPLCGNIALSELTGSYIQCAEADLEIAATIDEIAAVKDFMTAGFFLE